MVGTQIGPPELCTTSKTSGPKIEKEAKTITIPTQIYPLQNSGYMGLTAGPPCKLGLASSFSLILGPAGDERDLKNPVSLAPPCIRCDLRVKLGRTGSRQLIPTCRLCASEFPESFFRNRIWGQVNSHPHAASSIQYRLSQPESPLLKLSILLSPLLQGRSSSRCPPTPRITPQRAGAGCVTHGQRVAKPALLSPWYFPARFVSIYLSVKWR